MSYQALARKWRPKTFDQVIGQGHVVYFMHPEIGKGVAGAHNKDVDLVNDILPVHE